MSELHEQEALAYLERIARALERAAKALESLQYAAEDEADSDGNKGAEP